MSESQAIADLVEIEALRGEFTAAAMTHDVHRLASLFTHDGVLRLPYIAVEFRGREEIRAGRRRLAALWDFFVQETCPGPIQFDGGTAAGHVHVQEIGYAGDSREGLSYAVYRDRCRRTAGGWRFAERVYEARYLDISALEDAVLPARTAY